MQTQLASFFQLASWSFYQLASSTCKLNWTCPLSSTCKLKFHKLASSTCQILLPFLTQCNPNFPIFVNFNFEFRFQLAISEPPRNPGGAENLVYIYKDFLTSKTPYAKISNLPTYKPNFRHFPQLSQVVNPTSANLLHQTRTTCALLASFFQLASWNFPSACKPNLPAFFNLKVEAF